MESLVTPEQHALLKKKKKCILDDSEGNGKGRLSLLNLDLKCKLWAVVWPGFDGPLWESAIRFQFEDSGSGGG